MNKGNSTRKDFVVLGKGYTSKGGGLKYLTGTILTGDKYPQSEDMEDILNKINESVAREDIFYTEVIGYVAVENNETVLFNK